MYDKSSSSSDHRAMVLISWISLSSNPFLPLWEEGQLADVVVTEWSFGPSTKAPAKGASAKIVAYLEKRTLHKA